MSEAGMLKIRVKNPEQIIRDNTTNLNKELYLKFQNQKHLDDWLKQYREDAQAKVSNKAVEDLQFQLRTLLGIKP